MIDFFFAIAKDVARAPSASVISYYGELERNLRKLVLIQ